MVFEDQKWPIEEACKSINHEFDEFARVLNPKLWDDGAGKRSVHWAPPLVGYTKLNSDGSYLREEDRMGGTVVVSLARDCIGVSVLGCVVITLVQQGEIL